jgi:hypothetical protein
MPSERICGWQVNRRKKGCCLLLAGRLTSKNRIVGVGFSASDVHFTLFSIKRAIPRG